MSQAPGGNIPYVAISKTDTDSQAVLGDSTLIVEKLVEDGVTDDFHDRLFPTEEAHDLALRVLLEDKLYFYQVSRVSRYNSFSLVISRPLRDVFICSQQYKKD